jgi:phosphatidate cytidylyltransferase
MSRDPAESLLLLIFAVLSIVLAAGFASRSRFYPPTYLRYLWVFFLAFNVSQFVSFTIAVWILALLSFYSLREYFSLVDIRLQDRWGILAAYLSIPFMIYMVQIDWYGLFIISIPVYAFLVVPFLVAIGGKEASGTVFSIGVIDFGLFLFVYCLGHIAYLSLFSTWMAMLLVLSVALCDLIDRLFQRAGIGGRNGVLWRLLLSVPAVVALSVLVSTWTTIPIIHSVMLGVIIPLLVLGGNFTIGVIEKDLGIIRDKLQPGRGQIVNAIKSYLFTAPIVFHYIRYFVMR